MLDFLHPLDYPSNKYAELPQAAVLILIDQAQSEIIMIQKADHLRKHAGEVAFPGGKLESGETHIQCAIRECEEEIGVKENSFQTIGRLLPKVTRHRMAVHPFVAILNAGEPVSSTDALENQRGRILDFVIIAYASFQCDNSNIISEFLRPTSVYKHKTITLCFTKCKCISVRYTLRLTHDFVTRNNKILFFETNFYAHRPVVKTILHLLLFTVFVVLAI